MRHIVKKTSLCKTGILCFFQSNLQLVIEPMNRHVWSSAPSSACLLFLFPVALYHPLLIDLLLSLHLQERKPIKSDILQICSNRNSGFSLRCNSLDLNFFAAYYSFPQFNLPIMVLLCNNFSKSSLMLEIKHTRCIYNTIILIETKVKYY